MLRKWSLIVSVAVMASMVVSCGGRKVGRLDTASTVDLSGNWNDADSRMTSEALIKQCFEQSWLKKFAKENSRNPKVRVRNLTNKSDEHINMQFFVKNIERAMVNSGDVDVVAQANDTERGSIRDEQADGMSGNVSDESAASSGNEEGADFVLVGTLMTITDAIEGQKVKMYKTTMELINASSGKKVWMGDHEIKKQVEQAGVGF